MELLPLPAVETLRDKFVDTGTELVWRASGKPATHLVKGYLHVKLAGTRYAVHRLLWKMRHGDEPPLIDHRNGIRTDNVDSNMRRATRSQNMMNMAARSPRSGHKNVYPLRGKWRASLRVKRAYINGPTRATIAEAVADATALRLEHFGEFANGGVPSNS